MLTEIYVEALLVNEELADQVWEAWDKGEIDDHSASCILASIAYNSKQYCESFWSTVP